MRNPHYGIWPSDDDPADSRSKHRPGRSGWDLRDGLPEQEHAPVVTYRLPPEEIIARYGPPKPKPQATGHAGVMYQTKRPRPPALPMTRDVLEAMAAKGLSAREIARRLNRTERAVRMRAKLWGIALAESPDR